MTRTQLLKLREDASRILATIDGALTSEPEIAASPGRPRKVSKCRWCGLEMSERERRAHQGSCPQRPAGAPIPPGVGGKKKGDQDAR
jgi:hypothetical protein